MGREVKRDDKNIQSNMGLLRTEDIYEKMKIMKEKEVDIWSW